MVSLTREGIKDTAKWAELGVTIPARLDAIVEKAKENPRWMHYGPGNLFAANLAPIAQKLGIGVIAVEGHDPEHAQKIYYPHDNLRLRAIMPRQGDTKLDLVGNIADCLLDDPSRGSEWRKIRQYASAPSLQMISITCTESGYQVSEEDIKKAITNGPSRAVHPMAQVASSLYSRFRHCDEGVACVSFDNMAHNGARFKEAVLKIANAWQSSNRLIGDFVNYLHSGKVTFPGTMIDRVVPGPTPDIITELSAVEGIEAITTEKKGFFSPVVNTDQYSYLVIHDDFPNGRPDFSRASFGTERIYMVDDVIEVDRAERTKVGACLNPLHTALAVAGMLLGYEWLADEMDDDILRNYAEKLGQEGIQYVEAPECIDPKAFLKEFLEERLTNKKLGDKPDRIAKQTSQKLFPRYGQTIADAGNATTDLVYAPLAIATTLRYWAGINVSNGDFVGLDDKLQPMTLSIDGIDNANLKELAKYTSALDPTNGNTAPQIHDALQPILSNKELFGLNLYRVGLGLKIESMVDDMLQGKGTVRKTIEKYVGG